MGSGLDGASRTPGLRHLLKFNPTPSRRCHLPIIAARLDDRQTFATNEVAGGEIVRHPFYPATGIPAHASGMRISGPSVHAQFGIERRSQRSPDGLAVSGQDPLVVARVERPSSVDGR